MDSDWLIPGGVIAAIIAAVAMIWGAEQAKEATIEAAELQRDGQIQSAEIAKEAQIKSAEIARDGRVQVAEIHREIVRNAERDDQTPSVLAGLSVPSDAVAEVQASPEGKAAIQPDAKPSRTVSDPQPDASMRVWWCVAFETIGVHDSSERRTTCRPTEEYCEAVRAHQDDVKKTNPSKCTRIEGERPGDGLGVTEGWVESDCMRTHQIEGWLYPGGDLLAGR